MCLLELCFFDLLVMSIIMDEEQNDFWKKINIPNIKALEISNIV